MINELVGLSKELVMREEQIELASMKL